MITIILAGAALLLFGGGKKGRKSSSSSRTGDGSSSDPVDPPFGIKTAVYKGSSGGKIGEPGAYCKPPNGHPKGTMSAVSEDGTRCVVFWTPETAAVVRQQIQKELSRLPKAERDALCANDDCKLDPFWPDEVQMCDWVPDPNREAFVKGICLQLYPQINPSSLPLPPPDHRGNIQAPHFVKYVWTRVMAIFALEFCGFNPVT